tara:strand:- start:43151 stop:43792 length:642 start_codon:yes stop_codon:yes gene_type:complete
MLKLIQSILFVFIVNGLFAQSFDGSVQKDSTYYSATRMGVDTVAVVQLKEVVIPNAKNRRAYYKKLKKLTKNIVKVYPYAKLTGDILDECEVELAKIDNEATKADFMDEVEDDLKAEFEGELKKLTYSQGRLLIKLIDRETGETSYELIKKLKGGFSAFMWQGLARLFGSDLKSEFDAAEEDYMIELIVKKIENGEIKVAKRERKTSISLASS